MEIPQAAGFRLSPLQAYLKLGICQENLSPALKQEEEMEGVVILEGEEDLLDDDMDLDSGSRIQDVPRCVSQAVDPPGKRLSAVLRRIKAEKPRILSYDEIIEGQPKVAFPDELELEFEIPSEEMDL